MEHGLRGGRVSWGWNTDVEIRGSDARFLIGTHYDIVPNNKSGNCDELYTTVCINAVSTPEVALFSSPLKLTNNNYTCTVRVRCFRFL